MRRLRLAIIFSSVVFPSPFLPTSPYRRPNARFRSAPASRTLKQETRQAGRYPVRLPHGEGENQQPPAPSVLQAVLEPSNHHRLLLPKANRVRCPPCFLIFPMPSVISQPLSNPVSIPHGPKPPPESVPPPNLHSPLTEGHIEVLDAHII